MVNRGIITAKTVMTIVLIVLGLAVGYLLFKNSETFVKVWGPKIAAYGKALARSAG